MLAHEMVPSLRCPCGAVHQWCSWRVDPWVLMVSLGLFLKVHCKHYKG
jgi:hypothetical protein